MQTEHSILLVTADDDLLERFPVAFGSDPDYRVVICKTEKDAAARLNDIEIHLIVCDAEVLDDESSNVLVEARISHPHVARILIASPDTADRSAKVARFAAAYLYILKPIPQDLIRLVAKRALELSELSRRHRVLSRELKISMDDDIFAGEGEHAVKGGWSQFEKLVFASPKIADLCNEAKQAAQTDLPVLIQGETGTGKELLARAIHYNSSRMNSPMHVQNCGGVSDDTLHSELFGHVRGAFTGAIADRLGLFRAAHEGTVFLDEISEISPNFQVSLLRFLQEGEVKPLGADKLSYANVRIIAASNRPLNKLVEKGEFRRDLYYRLKGFELQIPSLRKRPEDIPVLAHFFIEKYAGVVGRRVLGITEDALATLQAYHFPGNVRELETEIRRMVAVADQGGYISSRHLSDVFREVAARRERDSSISIEGATLKEMVAKLEMQVVAASLQRNRWNQSKVAEELGLSRVGLANKIKRYGLLDA